MYHYWVGRSNETNFVADWIVKKEGGPMKYFDSNRCIRKWLHIKDKTTIREDKSHGSKQK